MSCLPWRWPPSPPSLVNLSSSLHHPSSFTHFKPCASHSTAAGGDRSNSITTFNNHPPLVLHDSLDAVGIETKLARAAREGFSEQVMRLSALDAETSIAISKGADLSVAALHVAAEDDSLVSHSSVPLPVEAFVRRIEDLALGFCSLRLLPPDEQPEVFLGNLERYLYVHKGFRRTERKSDARTMYLHSTLTRRSGSALMLSLIYSEILKTIRVYGFFHFDAEIYFPDDFISLPRGYHKQKSQVSDHRHIMTSQSLLVKMLTDLKIAFWPFPYDQSSSLFLRAARAVNHVHGSSQVDGKEDYNVLNGTSGLEIASAKAAHYRLERGVWTNVNFGDMRRALSACERLILLNSNCEELKDYAVLLYHCGFYKECLQFLKLYQDSKDTCKENVYCSNSTENLEEDAVNNLIMRVNLILQGDGWSKSKDRTSFWAKNFEPW